MHTILTVCSLLLLIATMYAASVAIGAATRAGRTADRLRSAMATISGLEASAESLTQQLQKLRGTFYAFKAAVEEPQFAADDPPPDPAPGATRADSRGCDNFRIAQLEGPDSRAAQCDCGYCNAMRRAREELRARAVPRTATGQAKLAKLNAGQSE